MQLIVRIVSGIRQPDLHVISDIPTRWPWLRQIFNVLGMLKPAIDCPAAKGHTFSITVLMNIDRMFVLIQRD